MSRSTCRISRTSRAGGVAVAGQEGVERVLAILQRELDITIALCGCASVADIGPDLIVR